jgi:hypothetical protein
MEGSGCGLIKVTVPDSPKRTEENHKTSVRIAGLLAKIVNHGLLKTNHSDARSSLKGWHYKDVD